MAELTNISLARGAPSLDIVAVDELRAAADRAFERDPGGMTAYGTSPGYTRLLEWLSKQYGVEPDQPRRHQRVDAGRRVPLQPARRARRRRGGRGADLRPHAARAAQARRGDPRDPARGGRHRRRGARRGARGRRAAEARPHHPQLPEPGGLHALAREAPAPARAEPRIRFHDLRGRPVRRGALRGRAACRRCSSSAAADGSVVYASSFSKTVCPGIRVGYLVGPRETIAGIRKEATETYISPNMVAQAIVAEFCDSGALDRSIETVRAALRERRDATCDAL